MKNCAIPQGDSGGPLQIEKNDINDIIMYTQIGITSFGKIFCGDNTPSVYTRVSKYIPWIEGIVWPVNLTWFRPVHLQNNIYSYWFFKNNYYIRIVFTLLIYFIINYRAYRRDINSARGITSAICTYESIFFSKKFTVLVKFILIPID